MDEVGGCCKDGATRAGKSLYEEDNWQARGTGCLWRWPWKFKDAEAAPTSARFPTQSNMTRVRMADTVMSLLRDSFHTRPAIYMPWQSVRGRKRESSVSTYLLTLATKCLLRSSPVGPASGTSVRVRARTVREEPRMEKEGANVPRAGERMSTEQTSGVDMFPALPRSHFLAHAHSRTAHFSCGPHHLSCGILQPLRLQ